MGSSLDGAASHTGKRHNSELKEAWRRPPRLRSAALHSVLGYQNSRLTSRRTTHTDYGKEVHTNHLRVFHWTGAFGVAAVVLWLSQFPLYKMGSPRSVYDCTTFGQHLFSIKNIPFEIYVPGTLDDRRVQFRNLA